MKSVNMRKRSGVDTRVDWLCPCNSGWQYSECCGADVPKEIGETLKRARQATIGEYINVVNSIVKSLHISNDRITAIFTNLYDHKVKTIARVNAGEMLRRHLKSFEAFNKSAFRYKIVENDVIAKASRGCRILYIVSPDLPADVARVCFMMCYYKKELLSIPVIEIASSVLDSLDDNDLSTRFYMMFQIWQLLQTFSLRSYIITLADDIGTILTEVVKTNRYRFEKELHRTIEALFVSSYVLVMSNKECREDIIENMWRELLAEIDYTDSDKHTKENDAIVSRCHDIWKRSFK